MIFLQLEKKFFVQVIDVDEYSKKASLSENTRRNTTTKYLRHHRFSNDRHKSGVLRPLVQQMPTWAKEGKVFFSKQEIKTSIGWWNLPKFLI